MMLKKKIRFTSYTEDKLTRLVKIGATKEKVIETIKNPEKVVDRYYERVIAQHLLTTDLILRVVYEECDEEIIIIAIYPGERRRYG